MATGLNPAPSTSQTRQATYEELEKLAGDATAARNMAIQEMTAMARQVGYLQAELTAAMDAMKHLAIYYTEAQASWGEAYVELAPFIGKSGLRRAITSDQLERIASTYQRLSVKLATLTPKET